MKVCLAKNGFGNSQPKSLLKGLLRLKANEPERSRERRTERRAKDCIAWQTRTSTTTGKRRPLCCHSTPVTNEINQNRSQDCNHGDGKDGNDHHGGRCVRINEGGVVEGCAWVGGTIVVRLRLFYGYCRKTVPYKLLFEAFFTSY